MLIVHPEAAPLNPKSEARNPKQTQISNDSRSETPEGGAVLSICACCFGFVSGSGLGIYARLNWWNCQDKPDGGDIFVSHFYDSVLSSR
jgi:hypothetical protein